MKSCSWSRCYPLLFILVRFNYRGFQVLYFGTCVQLYKISEHSVEQELIAAMRCLNSQSGIWTWTEMRKSLYLWISHLLNSISPEEDTLLVLRMQTCSKRGSKNAWNYSSVTFMWTVRSQSESCTNRVARIFLWMRFFFMRMRIDSGFYPA